MENTDYQENEMTMLSPEMKNRILEMFKNEGRNTGDVAFYLIENGFEESKAYSVSNAMLAEANESLIKERSQKDIMYGALWCVGGTVLTLADVGFIFWGAIVFGGFQLLRGVFKFY